MDIQIIDPTTIQNQKVLAFSAHPDDLEFMAGGAIPQLTANNSLTSIIATDGKMGTHDLNIEKDELIKVRQAESSLSASKMGIKKVIFWNYPDLGLRDWRKHLFKQVLKILLHHRPNLVITQDPWSRYEPAVHPDHRVLAEVVLEAILCSTLPLYLTRKGFDRRKTLSPKPEVWLTSPAEVSHLVDIASTLDQKISTLEGFVSQFDSEVIWQKVADSIKNRATKTASLLNNPQIKYAEGFRILK